MKRGLFLAVLSAFIFLNAVPSFADSSGDIMSVLQSMKDQMAKMQQTIDQQNARIQQLESKKVIEQPVPSVPVGAPEYQAKLTDADWQKGISDNLGTAVPWLKGAKWGGDLRLRYEGFKFYDKNNNDGAASKNLDHDYNRFRIRLRYGFEKDYGDDWKIGFRMATGTQTDQTSTNQTLGQYWAYKSIFIDRAFAQYTPNSMKDYGPIKGVTIGAGKFENPFGRYSTTLVWDPDVTPEGAYEKVNFKLMGTEDTTVNLYATLGQTIVSESTTRDTNANMFGYQGALNVSTYAFNTERPVSLTGAVSYYDYSNWAQTVSNNGLTDLIRTNTANADEFRVLDIYPELIFYVNNLPVTLWYDYAKNLANNGTEGSVAGTLGANDFYNEDTGWGVGGKIGQNTKKGTWEAYASYFAVGANAVPAAFNDSDFGGPAEKGFTNRKGYKFGLGYMLTDNLQLYWTTYLVSPLHISTLDLYSTNESVFRSQLDLVYKF